MLFILWAPGMRRYRGGGTRVDLGYGGPNTVGYEGTGGIYSGLRGQVPWGGVVRQVVLLSMVFTWLFIPYAGLVP